MDKRTLYTRIGIAVALLIIAVSVVGVARHQIVNAPKPPTPTPTLMPTPTNTPEPAPTEFVCAGGDIFFPLAKERLLDEYNIKVTVVRIPTFEVKNSDQLPELDCFWPGSYTAFEDFANAHPDMVVASATAFRTYNVFFTRADRFLPWYLYYGVVIESNGRYSMPMFPMITAMEQHWSWRQLFQYQAQQMEMAYDETVVSNDGNPDNDDLGWLDWEVNINYGAPEASSGSMQHALLLANCKSSPNYDCNHVVQASELGSINDPSSVMNFLVSNWERQPYQVKSSPDWFDAYRAKSGSYPLAASSESLFIGWYNGLPEDKRLTSGRQIVGIYPEVTISSDHVLIALRPEAKILVEIFKNDTILQQLAWDSKGMRTAVGDIGVAPGGTDISWIEADPLSAFEPKYDVFQAITQYIHK